MRCTVLMLKGGRSAWYLGRVTKALRRGQDLPADGESVLSQVLGASVEVLEQCYGSQACC